MPVAESCLQSDAREMGEAHPTNANSARLGLHGSSWGPIQGATSAREVPAPTFAIYLLTPCGLLLHLGKRRNSATPRTRGGVTTPEQTEGHRRQQAARCYNLGRLSARVRLVPPAALASYTPPRHAGHLRTHRRAPLRRAHRRCRPPPRLTNSAPGFHEYIPRDLVHYLVEAELRLVAGVFGRAAHVATPPRQLYDLAPGSSATNSAAVVDDVDSHRGRVQPRDPHV